MPIKDELALRIINLHIESDKPPTEVEFEFLYDRLGIRHEDLPDEKTTPEDGERTLRRRFYKVYPDGRELQSVANIPKIFITYATDPEEFLRQQLWIYLRALLYAMKTLIEEGGEDESGN
ncbi:MAG: hypothetical protein KAR06_11165 [Deltaproteobacteria bacterium]|nr:hypothetical protein [Deltaproteobacteria bacterium]